MHAALKSYHVVGPHTNLHFLRRLTSHPSFMHEELETGFIEKHREELFEPEVEPDGADLAQVGLYLAAEVGRGRREQRRSAWTDAGMAGWRVGGRRGSMVVELDQGVGVADADSPKPAVVRVTPRAPSFGATQTGFDVSVTGFASEHSSYSNLQPIEQANGTLSTLLDSSLHQLRIVPEPGSHTAGAKLHLFDSNKDLDAAVQRRLPAWLRSKGDEAAAKAGSARAPMPSRVVQVMVAVGQAVKRGDPLVMVEAMKTEHVLRAPKDGVVSKVGGVAGQLVPEGAVLVEFEAEAESA